LWQTLPKRSKLDLQPSRATVGRLAMPNLYFAHWSVRVRHTIVGPYIVSRYMVWDNFKHQKLDTAAVPITQRHWYTDNTYGNSMYSTQGRCELDWIVQCFMSPPTQYRLYGRRFLQVKRPNKQYQSTEGKSCKGKQTKKRKKTKITHMHCIHNIDKYSVQV